jgi:hypothetical protein
MLDRNIIGKRFGVLDELPPQITKQIKTKDRGTNLAKQITQVINDYEGIATCDEILVGLYRKFGLTLERKKLAQKINALNNGHHLRSAGKNGFYTTKKELENYFAKEEI